MQNYEAMLRYMFQYKFSVAGAARLALNNIVFCSDRGYWQVGIILLILGFGGSVFGTLMRKEWVPFTYDQKHPGKRRVIEKKYGRSIFLAFGRWCNNMLKIMAFRSGTGSVSLAMDSDGNETSPQIWEFCFRNNGDAKWYKSTKLSKKQRKLKAFQSIDKIVVSEQEQCQIDHHLYMLPVTMLTCQDMDFSWVTLRKFSLTSTSSEATIKNAAPYVPPNDDVRPAYEIVLKYASMTNHLSDPEDAMSVDSSSVDEEMPIDATLVTKVIKSMRAGRTQESLDDTKKDAKRIMEATDTLSSSKLETMLIAMGMRHDRVSNKLTEDDKKKKLKLWARSITACASAEKYQFPYAKLLDAKDVQVMLETRAGDALAKGDPPGPVQNPKNTALRIEALQHIDNDPSFQQTANERDPAHNPLMHAVLAGIVKRGFLQPLDKNEKKEARLGHQNEPKYLAQYYEDSKKGRVPGIEICDIKRPGMAMQENRSYVRASADAIAIEHKRDDDDVDDDFDLMTSHPVECKCRAQLGWNGSLARAKSIQTKVARELGQSEEATIYGRGEAAYLKISSSQHKLIETLIPDKSERIQILHHAYTYSCNKTTFLVGGPEGNLLYGLIVTFEDELLNAYGDVLEFLYNSGLHLFYSHNTGDLPRDLIGNIILNDDTLKKKYTIDDLMTSALICRELLPGSSSKVQYPIPACDMLVPHEYALWNVSKGGSDTVTKYTWNCLTVLPIKTPQTVVVARYLAIYAVLYHRLLQAVTGTKKPNAETDTIQNVRERANQRLAFHKSLGILSNFHLLKSKISDESKDKGVVVKTDFPKTPAPRFNRRDKDTQLEVDHSILGESTGATPIGKGKGTGKAKKALESNENYVVIKQRNVNCTGVVGRIYVQNSDGTFQHDRGGR